MRKTIIKESSKIALRMSFWIIAGVTLAGLWFKFGLVGNIVFELIKIA